MTAPQHGPIRDGLPISTIDQSEVPEVNDYVRQLADSIATVGLLQPIVVEDVGARRVRLVAGRRRLAACKSLGWERIPIHYRDHSQHRRGKAADAWRDEHQQTLIEISTLDENLIRHELTAAERATLTDRRKALYLRLHPETGRGTAGGKASGRARGEQRPTMAVVDKSFVSDTAKKTGKSERSVRRDAQIGKALNESPEVSEVIAGTKVENSKAALLEIAQAPKERRTDVAKERVAKSKAPQPKRQLHPMVAARSISPVVDPSGTVELVRLRAAWAVASDSDRTAMLAEIEQPKSKAPAQLGPDSTLEECEAVIEQSLVKMGAAALMQIELYCPCCDNTVMVYSHRDVICGDCMTQMTSDLDTAHHTKRDRGPACWALAAFERMSDKERSDVLAKLQTKYGGAQ